MISKKIILSAFAFCLLFANCLVANAANADQAYPLSQGDYGSEVIALHFKFNELGLSNIRAESPFGPDDTAVVKILQAVLNADQTGNVESREQYEAIMTLEPTDDAFLKRNLLYNPRELQLGETNYLKNVWRYGSGGFGLREVVEIKDSPIAGISEGFHVKGSSADSLNTDVAMNNVPVQYGAEYVLSCYAKGSGKIKLMYGKNPYPHGIYDIDEKWKMYTFELTVGKEDGSTELSPVTTIFFGSPVGYDTDLYICGMSLTLK